VRYPPLLPLARSRDALFDQAAAEIGVDEISLRACDGVGQAIVTDALTPGEAREPACLKDSHSLQHPEL
jgi:hypothetical protein